MESSRVVDGLLSVFEQAQPFQAEHFWEDRFVDVAVGGFEVVPD